MNGTELVSLFISFSNRFVPIGLTVILQSTIIIGVGLVVQFILRKRNSTLQSIVLRATLIIIILTPLVSVLFLLLRVNQIQVPLPIETEIVKQQQTIKGMNEFDKTSNIDSEHFRSNDMVSPKGITNKTLKENDDELLHSQTLPDNKKVQTTEHRNKSEKNPPVYSNSETETDVIIKDRSSLVFRFPGTTMGILTFLYCVFTTIWIISSVYFLFKSIIVSLCIVYIRYTGYRAKKNYQNICKDTASILGMTAPPVLQHPVVNGTFVCGFIKPVIVLPYGHQEQATREVFLHELAHLARQDNLWNLACQIAIIMLPVQPLISTFLKKISEVNDFACDDYVLAFGGNKRSYAIQLFNISKTFHPGVPEATLGTGIISSSSPIFDRIERILDTSYIRIIKVKAFEIFSVIIFSFSSLTLSGFVGFKGNPTNGKRQFTQAGKQHIERIISYVPTNMKHQSTLHVDTPIETDKQVEIIGAKPHKEEKPYETLNIEHLEDNRGKIINTEFADSEKFSMPEKLYKAEIDQSQQHLDTGNGSDYPPVDYEPVTETDNIKDNNNHTSQTTQETLKPVYDSEDNIITETENVDMIFQDNDASNASSFAAQDYFGLTGSPTVSSGEINDLAYKTLNIVISYDFENADLTNPEEKLSYDMYRSLENNKLYPVWSPDGSNIVITDRRYGIWMVPVKGGEPNLIYRNDPVRFKDVSVRLTGIEPLCFSPGGRELTYKRYTIDEDMGTEVIIDDSTSPPHVTIMNPVPVIETLHMETGISQVIAKGAAYGRWSSDGSLFLYTRLDTNSFKELMIRDVYTGHEYPIDEFEAHNIQLSSQDRYLMFSKDDLFMIPGTGELKRFSLSGDVTFSDISRDARWILYTYDKSLYVYDTHEEEATELFPGQQISPSWARFSPDLTNICFSLKSENSRWGVYLYDFGEITGHTGIDEATTIKAFELKQNFPNPFNSSTTIQFSLPEQDKVSLVIYNMMGQRIREIVSGEFEPGLHSIVWDSRDDSGHTVATGTYFAWLTTENHKESITMSLVK